MTTAFDPSGDSSIEARDPVNRRRFLRGVGSAIALPAFASLAPRSASAALTANPLAVTQSGAPLRMAFVYFPNGAIQDTWWPKGEGKEFELARTMTPLEPLKDKIMVMSGLDHINATAGKDGPGDHARANGTFLTGVRVKKTSGGDIHAGVSVDQIAAERIAGLTRFSSLELTCDAIRKSGNCDSGYSCAYQHNLSCALPRCRWRPSPIQGSCSKGSSGPVHLASARRTWLSDVSRSDRSSTS